MVKEDSPLVARYHRSLCKRLRAILREELVGVYATGSFALGDFDLGRSDLDVAAVTRRSLGLDQTNQIVEALSHEALPCPARGLEFVAYRASVARYPSAEAGFELNLNTGRAMARRVDTTPDTVEGHWFPIDRAIIAGNGVALYGPPAAEVFAPFPRELLLPILRESLEWHRRHLAQRPDAVLNACRALAYLNDGSWLSKTEAAHAVLNRVACPEVVAAALRGRAENARLSRDRVEALVDEVISKLS